MQKYFSKIVLLLIFVPFIACEKEYEKYDVDLPSFGIESLIGDTDPLTKQQGENIEGIYTVVQGNDLLGEDMVLKYINGSISVFGRKDGIYMVLNIGQMDGLVVMEGYWRQANTGGSDKCRFLIKKEEGGNNILSGTNLANLNLNGVYINNGNAKVVQLKMQRFLTPESSRKKMAIMGHRAGGRTADRMHISENSVEMVRYTEHLGSTGIEIDIQLTKDGIPVVYHDPDLNIRLIKKGPIMGKISDYTYAQISSLVRLYHGEKLPLLDDMLKATVHETNLRFVWLDIKDPQAMSAAYPIQQKYMQEANDLEAQGKRGPLYILQGLPSDEMVNAFMQINGYQNILSLCELTLDDVRKANAKVWAPRWTRGLQTDEVNAMHNEGRYTFVWTLDGSSYMEDFIRNSQFDAVLTNYPTLAAYYYYINN